MEWITQFLDSTTIWTAVSFLYGLTILVIIVIILSENRNPVKSLAWITVLLVVPMVGAILYIVFGRNIQTKRIISRHNRRKLKRLSARRSTPIAKVPLPSKLKRQITLSNSLCGAEYYQNNRVDIYNNGTDKFKALLADIAAARSFINLQYYILSDDDIGTKVIDALIEKARAGVKVRVIYDHVGSFKLRRRTLRRMKEAGIEAYPFFKVVFPPFGTRINWRNHRKLVVIDGKVGYIGGMNIADRYIDGGKHFNLWRDLHLRIEGDAVIALHKSFAVDWNFMGQPLIDDEIAPREKSRPGTAGMQLVVGGPTSQWLNMTFMLQQAISHARRCVYIQTPYFIPSEGLLQALQICALSKVDVRIMLPRRSDSDMLRWASNSYIAECLRSGIKVYLFTPGMLHSKAIIIDDDFATVGSTNFDCRSFEHNFEANLLIYSPDENKRLKDLFFEDLKQCRRVNPAQWRKRPLAEKALESFMRLFSPIL